MLHPRRLYISLMALAVCAALGAGAAHAEWFEQFTESFFQADEDNQRHPNSLVQTLVVSESSDGNIFVCTAVGHNSGKHNNGRIDLVVEITREEETEDGATAVTTETIDFSGKIKDNHFIDCKNTRPLETGDILIFHYKFSKWPRLQFDNEAKRGKTDVISAITESKLKVDAFANPAVRDETGANPPPDTGGGGGGGGNDGGGGDDGGGGTSGPLTATDQNAVLNTYRQVRSGVGAQAVVANTGFRLDVRVNGVVSNFPSSGFAGSWASAGSALCKKFSCVSGGIPTTLQNNLRKLINVSRSGGRWIIALRQESGGKWYVDFIKGTTGFHGTAHSSDTAAVNAFCNSAQAKGLC